MTKPTTFECIEWLDKAYNNNWIENEPMYKTIRAQLLAAQEMAKALERAAKQFSFYEQLHSAKEPPDLIKAKSNHDFAVASYEALTAWREAGGE